MRAVLASAWWLRLSSGALCQQLSSSPCSSACKGCTHQHPSLTPSKHEQLCAPPAADAGQEGSPCFAFAHVHRAGSRQAPGIQSVPLPALPAELHQGGQAGSAHPAAGPEETSLCAPVEEAGQGRHAPGGEEPTRAVGTLARSIPAGVELGTPRCYRTFPSCSSGCVSVAKATGEPGAGRTSDPQSPERRGTGEGAGTGTHQPGASVGSGGNRCRA